MELLNKVAEFFVGNEYRLLIIDSIMALFRVDYTGRGELNERQQKLNQFLSKLTHVAEGKPVNRFFSHSRSIQTEFNVAVLMTNQVQSDPGASALFASADGRKPVGGHILAHASATRILLRKGRGDERVAKIQDSPGRSASSPFSGILLTSMAQTCLRRRRHTSSRTVVSTTQRRFDHHACPKIQAQWQQICCGMKQH